MMKNYKEWLNEDAQQNNQVAQVQEKPEKIFDTNQEGTKLKISTVLDMIAYSISLFGDKKQLALPQNESNLKVGEIYLYTNKKGHKFPVRLLSLDNKLEMKGGVPFYKEDITDEELKDTQAYVQTTRVSNHDASDAIITSKNSYGEIVIKNKLEKIEPGSKYDWFNMSVNKLQETAKKLDKNEQKYISKFIETLKKLTKKWDDENANLKNLLNFDYFYNKQSKQEQQPKQSKQEQSKQEQSKQEQSKQEQQQKQQPQ